MNMDTSRVHGLSSEDGIQDLGIEEREQKQELTTMVKNRESKKSKIVGAHSVRVSMRS